ncbi:DUF4139 domain-containing protein [Geovibrio thiophilus]|uniref:DUF4139 domain-containing protein n=1 Tax=Geovibrio thiophilus TaxID=139438 RepID=A0A3R6AWN9_9BACT|nr:DUF4139 domain-containing protein [Geovibrio thiophilus]QAR32238.1 DUF4139 domain-containing protein [Geovibrio thiophilus]
MKPVIAILAFLTCANAFAAEFYLHRDKAEYRTGEYKSGVIGYGSAVKAYCGTAEMMLIPSADGAEGWLGALAQEIKNKENDYIKAESRKKTAEFMLNSIGEVSSVDKLSDGRLQAYAAARFAEISKAEADMKKAQTEAAGLRALFAKGADSETPLHSPYACADMKLVLDKITADYENVLYIDGKGAATELVLKAVNRSGVDIKAQNAYLLPSYLNEAIAVPQFDPWYVRPFEPVPLAKTARTSAAPLMFEAAADYSSAPSPEVSREAPAQFRVKDFTLISDGRESRTVLDRADVEAESRLAVYPFRSPVVYRETVFTPKSEVYGSKWRVSAGREIFENVYASVENGRIRLAAGTDKDISVKRKSLPLTRESDGFFGTKKRMKRGFTIEAANLAGEAKKLNITDRLPVAADDRISIENIMLNGKRIDAAKDGRLEIITELKAGGTAVYTVTFELVADKDMEVVF